MHSTREILHWVQAARTDPCCQRLTNRTACPGRVKIHVSAPPAPTTPLNSDAERLDCAYEPKAPASEWMIPAGIHSLALRARIPSKRFLCAQPKRWRLVPCARGRVWRALENAFSDILSMEFSPQSVCPRVPSFYVTEPLDGGRSEKSCLRAGKVRSRSVASAPGPTVSTRTDTHRSQSRPRRGPGERSCSRPTGPSEWAPGIGSIRSDDGLAGISSRPS